MPSTTVFDREPVDYKLSVLPAGIPRVAVEMGVTDGWWKYGCAAVLGLDRFGESAPAPALLQHFGFTAENLAAIVQTVLAGTDEAHGKGHDKGHGKHKAKDKNKSKNKRK